MSVDAYILQSIPGKGKGLVASRAILRGELILADSPLFTQDLSYSNNSILDVVSGLSDAQQRGYIELTNAHRGVLPPALGTFKTNALPCGDHDSSTVVRRGALCLIGSRFNSSCEPNVNHYWSEEQQKVTFWALRDIAEGEELLIAYCELFADRSARRARLRKLFRFECACVACSRTGSELQASDERRTTLAQLYREIGMCGGTPAAGIRKVKEAIRLLSEERLLGISEASFCYDGFQFCATVSDARNAKLWATKAWEGHCAYRGPTSHHAEKLKRYMKSPCRHPSFGLLPQQVLSGPE
ncbi:SET domain-containing protein [Trametes polyzona]|nr:SET domain-containing protein [Trametes polyzona]